MKKLLIFILLVTSCPAWMWSQSVAGHPRLLMGAGEEEGIRAMLAEDEAVRRVHEGVVREADGMLGLPVLERVMEGKRLLKTSREALRRIFWLSYSYRMTDEGKYADRAIEEMLAVCRFSDWNPSHFLDVAEMTMAVAIGYDWLHDRLTADEKVEIYDSIVNKAFIPADNEEYAGFYNLANNWNQVCCCGLLYGALAIYERQPEKSQELIGLYVKSVPFAMAAYAPDGGYPEGFMYWGYGTSFQVMMIAALESAIGTDFGLSSSEGFLETADFVRFMTAPSGQCFNFSDATAYAPCNPMMFWFASKTSDSSKVWLERRYLESLPENFMSDVSRRFAEHRLLPALMVFASRLQTMDAAPPEETVKVFRGQTPLFVCREGWDSPDDAYLGIKGGSPITSHAHMDAGSFIYEYGGVRWSVDLGPQDYHSLESVGINLWDQGEGGRRWDIFRLGNDSHSTVSINGRSHIANSFVPIKETWSSAEKKGARLDMTGALGEGVQRAEREIWLDKMNYLHVHDIIAAGTEDVEIRWLMTTSADAEIMSGGGIRLNQGGKTMILDMEAGSMSPEVHIWSNDPPHWYDASNPGTRRVGFTLKIPAGATASLKVCLSE